MGFAPLIPRGGGFTRAPQEVGYERIPPYFHRGLIGPHGLFFGVILKRFHGTVYLGPTLHAQAARGISNSTQGSEATALGRAAGAAGARLIAAC